MMQIHDCKRFISTQWKVYLGSFEGQLHQEYLPQDLLHKCMIHSDKKKKQLKIFFSFHINPKLMLSNSSSLKSVFKKLCLCDKSVRAVHLSTEIKLCSPNLVSCHLKMDHMHVRISLVPDKTRF